MPTPPPAVAVRLPPQVQAPRLAGPVRAALAALLLTWAWYGHFWPHFHAANESIRLYFIQAVVEDRTPTLDAVVRRHGSVPVDRSERDGRIYMDKAPGLSLLALPLYPLMLTVDPGIAYHGLWRFGWLACVCTVALPLLAALALLARYLARLGVSHRDALTTVLALGLCSPLLVYAGLFFGHGLAAACVAIGVFLVLTRAPAELSTRRAFAAGLALGYGGFTDTPVFALAALCATFFVLRAGIITENNRLRAGLRVGLPVAAGLGLLAAAQLAYNAWVLGDALAFTYQFKGDAKLAAIMATGWLGFRPPQSEALWGLWFGARRGLLYHAPWLLLALAGHALTLRSRALPLQVRVDAGGLLGLTLLYALLVSGFADWPAGDCVGARHLLPIVPLAGCGLGLLLHHVALPPIARALVPAGLVLGLLLALPSVASFPYHFDNLQLPVLELGWPLVVTGYFAPSLGRLAGWSDWVSFAVFLFLLVLPWLALPALPAPARPGHPMTRPLTLAGWAALLVVAWTTALVAVVPPPRRKVELARFRATQLLGPSATERDGDTEWQQLLRKAGQQPNRP